MVICRRAKIMHMKIFLTSLRPWKHTSFLASFLTMKSPLNRQATGQRRLPFQFKIEQIQQNPLARSRRQINSRNVQEKNFPRNHITFPGIKRTFYACSERADFYSILFPVFQHRMSHDAFPPPVSSAPHFS